MFRWILLWLTVLMGGACSSYYYAPNTLHTPHLKERHDTQVSLGGLTGPEFSGFELHGSYAVSHRWALMANYMDLAGGSTSGESRGRGRLGEGALGLYFPLGEEISTGLFLGWGTGNVLYQHEGGVRSRLNFHRYFGQYYVSVERGAFRLGTALRLNYLQYRKGWIDYRIGEPHVSKIELIEERSPFLFPEIGVSAGVGSRPIWVNFFFNVMEYQPAEELGLAEYTAGVSMVFQMDYFWRAEKLKK